MMTEAFRSPTMSKSPDGEGAGVVPNSTEAVDWSEIDPFRAHSST